MDSEKRRALDVNQFLECLSSYFLVRGTPIEEGIALCSSYIIHVCARMRLSKEDFKELLQKMMQSYMHVEQETVEEE